MKALITGMNGTIGEVLSQYLEDAGYDVIEWDRKVVSIFNYADMEYFIDQVEPDVVFHLAVNSRPTGIANENWLVNYNWPSELAWICKQNQIKFIFTSTVMVFSDFALGPFTPQSIPDANKGYGFEKRIAEERVMYQNPDAVILRLGWQIGNRVGNNNMYDFLVTRQREAGKIEASEKWYPACSFLEDTVDVLMKAVRYNSGIYLVDSNLKWNFYDIVCALNQYFNANWDVVKVQNFWFDQRMLDDRVKINSLSKRLKKLK